jgi:hypothetical protein
MEAMRHDAVPLKATMTPEGYIIDSPILGRTGVQVYRRTDGREIREYRPPTVVFAPEHLAAIRGRPIIDGHVPRVDAANVRAHTVGTILSEGRQDGDHLRADIIIHDPSPVLKGGKRSVRPPAPRPRASATTRSSSGSRWSITSPSFRRAGLASPVSTSTLKTLFPSTN